MKGIFDFINSIFEFMVPITDFLWEFPTNIDAYANIPVLGKFSLAIILLVGAGIYFTVKTKFVQVKYFKRGLKVLVKKKVSDTGVSPLAAFLLSSAMRVGPGNIVGVTGAISAGGPGALSGCGYPHSSVWQQLMQKQFCLRFLKKRKMMNL